MANQRTFIVVLDDDLTTTEMGLEAALTISPLVEGRVHVTEQTDD